MRACREAPSPNENRNPTDTPVACMVDGILKVIRGCEPYTAALATVWAYEPDY